MNIFKKNSFSLILIFCISLFAFSQPAPNLNISVNSTPQGAYFTINPSSTKFGPTPTSVKLLKGRTFSLTFTKPGYGSKTISYYCDGNPIYVDLDGTNNEVRPLEKDKKNEVRPLEQDKNNNDRHDRDRDRRSENPPQPPKPIMFNLSINSNVNGAQVFINGQPAGAISSTFPLPQGTYSITVKANGYREFSRSVKLENNENIFAKLEAEMNALSISSNINGAQVFINGQQYGSTPCSVNLIPGSYNVVVKMGGYREFSTSVNLNRDQNIVANLEQDRFITIKIPRGAKIFINNQPQRVDWDERGRNRDSWKTFTFQPNSDSPRATVRIEYFELTVEKQIEFTRGTISLALDLR
jgi:hypothetical protein